MSLESTHKKLESEYGRLPDAAWDDIVEHCVYEDEDEEDCFLDSARQVLDVANKLAGANKTATGKKTLPQKPGRKPGWSGYYAQPFSDKYALHCFWLARQCEEAYAGLMGEEYIAPTLKELYQRYKAATDPYTGQPLGHIPKTFGAFKKALERAETEFGNLTEEDRVDWRGQMFVDAFLEAQGWQKPRTFLDSFQIIWDKRGGNAERRKELWALIERLADAYAPETQGVAEEQAAQDDLEQVWTLQDWTLDEDAPFEDIMLAIGAREGWPEFHYRLRFTISAGEESWRQLVPQVSQQDKDDFLAAMRLVAACRERQAAQDESPGGSSAPVVVCGGKPRQNRTVARLAGILTQSRPAARVLRRL